MRTTIETRVDSRLVSDLENLADDRPADDFWSNEAGKKGLPGHPPSHTDQVVDRSLTEPIWSISTTLVSQPKQRVGNSAHIDNAFTGLPYRDQITSSRSTLYNPRPNEQVYCEPTIRKIPASLAPLPQTRI